MASWSGIRLVPALEKLSGFFKSPTQMFPLSECLLPALFHILHILVGGGYGQRLLLSKEEEPSWFPSASPASLDELKSTGNEDLLTHHGNVLQLYSWKQL